MAFQDDQHTALGYCDLWNYGRHEKRQPVWVTTLRWKYSVTVIGIMRPLFHFLLATANLCKGTSLKVENVV